MTPPSVPGLRDLDPIGVGGFAEVFRAVEAPFDRVVAVKVLTARPGDDSAVRAFERECRALGQVGGHPNIVTVHSAGTTADGRPYLVMGYEPGGSLQDHLDAGLRPDPLALMRLGADLADALATAHRSGVLHRDVKPANVLLSAQEVPKLSDFGIARLVDETATSGRVTASLMHAPPEQLDGRPASPAGDAYSLGSTLATLALGHPPFLPDNETNVLALLSRVALEPPPDLRASGQPAELAELISALMRKDPAARPQDLGQVAAHLRRMADRHTGPAVGAAGVDTAGSSPAAPRRRDGRRRGLVAGGVAAAVVLTGAIGALALSRDDGGDPGPVPLLADLPAVQLAESVDLSDPSVLAQTLITVEDLPKAEWVETGDSRFAGSESLNHPVANFDVCEVELDGDLVGAAAGRSYIAEDPDGGDLPIAVGVNAVQLTGDGDVLQQQVLDAYGACTEWDNSLIGGGSEPTEILGIERVAVGPYEGVRSRIRFPSDGQVLEETRVVADGVSLTVQVDGDRIAAADRDRLLAVLLTNLSRLS